MCSRRVLLLVLVTLLISVALGRTPGGSNKKKRRGNRSVLPPSSPLDFCVQDREYRNAFSACEKTTECSQLERAHVPKCALKCLSMRCYDQIYGEDEVLNSIFLCLIICSSSLESWITTAANSTRFNQSLDQWLTHGQDCYRSHPQTNGTDPQSSSNASEGSHRRRRRS